MINLILTLGIISSLLFYELTEISPGGIIAPVYLAMYVDNPQKIFITLIISILAYLVVKLLSNFIIIYGRRKFAVYILVSIVLKYLLDRLGLFLLDYEILISMTSAIGIIIPAIIARDIEKQGYLKTIVSVLIVAIFIKASVEIITEVKL